MEQKNNNFKFPNFRELITENMISNIREVEYFADSQYSQLEIRGTLEFFTKRYVKQLFDFMIIDETKIIADVGTGFGWLPMAFAYSTNSQLIAIDLNKERLKAGEKIARILGIEQKIDWRSGSLGELPLNDQEVDVVYCIEVLEHVKKSSSALLDLARVTKNLMVFTTPNLWFPVISHDTRLPFCHWLPIPLRIKYSKLFKINCSVHNLFWSPFSLKKHMKGFKPVSKWLHYSSYSRFKETFPFYLPYNKGKYISNLSLIKKAYYNLISKLGIISHYFAPSLSYVLKKNPKC